VAGFRDEREGVGEDAVNYFENNEPKVQGDSDGESGSETRRCVTMSRDAMSMPAGVISGVVPEVAHL